jgi:hypothetical protein
METMETMETATRPLDRRFVAGWAGATALGWAITALGVLPNLSSLDFSGISVDDYAQHLWLPLGLGLLCAALGGLAMAAAQAWVLRGYGYSPDRRAVGLLAGAWPLIWGLVAGSILLLQIYGDFQLTQATVMLKPLALQTLAMLGASITANRLVRILGLPKSEAGNLYRLHILAWVVGVYGYFGLHRLDDARQLPGRVMVAALVGGLAGALAATLLRWVAQRRMARPNRALGGGVILAAIVVFLSATMGTYGFCYFRGCADPWPPGPPAPWAEQWAAAQAEAARYDPAAVPGLILAAPPEYRVWNADFHTLAVRFIFENTALTGGSQVEVGLLDTAPAATVRGNRSSAGFVSNDSAAEQALVRQALALVQISPAEALQRTVPDIQALLAQHSGMVSVNVNLWLPTASNTAQPLAWRVTYYTDDHHFLEIQVDARTGEILSRKLEP